MRLATVQQSREIDELSQKVYGLSGEVLMESAGALAAREIDLAYFPELSRGAAGVICGPGNNGGDGLVLARHMHSAGHRDLVVYLVGEQSKRSELFKLQLERAQLHGLRIVDLNESPDKWEQMRSSTLLIDALLGIGLCRALQDDFLKAVEMINSSRVAVVSLDCPTGLDSDRGVAEGSVVKASMTLSFGLAKPGFFVGLGPQHVGNLRVLPIGFPFESLRGTATTHFLFNEKLARRYLPQRKDTANKSDFGHLVVLAGQRGHWGAGLLASQSAFRMGVGYVTWSSLSDPTDVVVDAPEVMFTTIDDSKLWSEKITAYAVGPGLGVSQETADLIERLRQQKATNVVLDADAITTCVQYDLFPLPSSWVLTPHAGELSRVIGVDSREIESDRFSAVKKAVEVCGCHVLLKGFRSVLAFEERCMVINAGNSALAKAGTGDVLTGMIGALLAQGLETLQATATAAYIHGRLADEWVRVGHDKNSLSASDIRDHLPQLMARVAGGALVG